MKLLSALLPRCEFLQPQPNRSQGEVAIAVLGCVVWFGAILLRLSLGETGDWRPVEAIVEASSFVYFAALPIFFLATVPGARLVKTRLLPHHGLGVQVWLCGGLATLIGLAPWLRLNPDHFPWIRQLNDLIWPQRYGLNALIFIAGVAVAARIPFVMLTLRDRATVDQRQRRSRPTWEWTKRHRQLLILLGLNTLYLWAVHTSLIAEHPGRSTSEGFLTSSLYLLVCVGMNAPGWQKPRPSPPEPLNAGAPNGQRLYPFDFFVILLCVAIIYWLSVPSFNFGVFVAADLFIVALVYGTGLGSSHFGYSFAPRRQDVVTTLKMVGLAVVVLVPLAIALGFVRPELARGTLSVPRLVSYFALFTLRVGVFEELFFRSGLMVFLRDQLRTTARDRHWSPQYYSLICALGASIVFGLVHIGNEPSPGSLLSTATYRLVYIVLATLASGFYSFTFGETNRLLGPILVHGFVDTTAVLLLGGFLAVPF